MFFSPNNWNYPAKMFRCIRMVYEYFWAHIKPLKNLIDTDICLTKQNQDTANAQIHFYQTSSSVESINSSLSPQNRIPSVGIVLGLIKCEKKAITILPTPTSFHVSKTWRHQAAPCLLITAKVRATPNITYQFCSGVTHTVWVNPQSEVCNLIQFQLHLGSIVSNLLERSYLDKLCDRYHTYIRLMLQVKHNSAES